MTENEIGIPPEASAPKKKEGIFDESFLIIITGLGNVFNFIFHIYMSRNLGADGYSTLGSLMSLVFVLGMPIVTVQTTITKFVAQFNAQGEDANVRRLFFECLKRVCVVGFLLMAGMIFGAPFIGEFFNIEKNTPIVVSGLIMFVMYVMPVFWAILQGREQFGFLGASYFVGFTTKCVLGIIFAIIGWGVGGVLLGVVLSFFLAFAVGVWPTLGLFAPTLDEGSIDMKAIYKFAGPVIVSLFFMSFFCNLDIALVRNFYGEVAEGKDLAGYYATASIVGKSFLFLPLGIVLALFPKVSRKKATGENPLPILLRGLAIEFVLSIGGIIFCMILARYVALFLGKTDAPELVALIRFFGIAITPVAATTILVNYNLANDQHGFIWIFVALTVLTFAGIWFIHTTPLTVLLIIGLGGFFIFLWMLVFTIRSLKRTET